MQQNTQEHKNAHKKTHGTIKQEMNDTEANKKQREQYYRQTS